MDEIELLSDAQQKLVHAAALLREKGLAVRANDCAQIALLAAHLLNQVTLDLMNKDR